VLREQTVWVYAGLPDSTRSRRRPLELGMSRVELTFVTVRALDVSLCESVRVCTSLCETGGPEEVRCAGGDSAGASLSAAARARAGLRPGPIQVSGVHA